MIKYLTAAVILASTFMPVLQAAEIRLRRQAETAGAIVRLGDVADIVGSGDEIERLAAIELGPAGAARQTLRMREIQDRLTAQGVKLDGYRFSGAAQVVVAANEAERSARRPVTRTLQNLARTNAADAILRRLKEAAGADEEWTITPELSDEQVRWLSAARNIEVTGGQAPWSGSQRFTLKVQTDKGMAQFPVNALVESPPQIVVSNRAIAKGERIHAGDVEVQRLKPGASRRNAFEKLDEVIGREAARNIPIGQPIDADYVRSPIVVRRGDVVDLYSRAGGVQVRTKARSREDGGQGDLITVELLSDRQALLTRVCGVQEVEILAASASVSE